MTPLKVHNAISLLVDLHGEALTIKEGELRHRDQLLATTAANQKRLEGIATAGHRLLVAIREHQVSLHGAQGAADELAVALGLKS